VYLLAGLEGHGSLSSLVRLRLYLQSNSSPLVTACQGKGRAEAMKILLVYPKFPDTYWSFRHALGLWRATI
jgi:hypothetical protein